MTPSEASSAIVDWQVVIGFLGGVLTSFVIVVVRRHLRRRALRKALLTELQLPGEVIQQMKRQNPEEADQPLHSNIPTTVYTNRRQSIGLLTPAERMPVVAYYETAEVAREQLQSIDDDRVAEEFFGETVEMLDRKRQAAISAITSRLWVTREELPADQAE